VEEDEETEREDERMAKRPDFSELDVLECAEQAWIK
jgi:hypothetical protein